MRRLTAAILSNCPGIGDRSSRFPLAHAALRVLAAAGDRGDRNAIEAVWQVWLRCPDDRAWEMLTRWRGAGALAEAAFGAATDPGRAATARSAIGKFCVRCGLLPDGDAERALFWMMTGQPDQHRAADPDGSALTAAYQGANEPVRAVLRQAMAEAGNLDLVRVMARGRDTVPVTEAERSFLAAEFARGEEWPRLWRLALEFPLAEAVAAARLLPASWRPADEAGRSLLALLAAADPARIEATARPVVTRLDIGRQTIWLTCHFARDFPEVAVRSQRQLPSGGGTSPRAAVYALPGGARLETFRDVQTMLHLSEAIVYIEDIPHSDKPPRLLRYVRGRGSEELLRRNNWQWGAYPPLVRVREGFVFAKVWQLMHGTTEPGSQLCDVTPSDLRLGAGTGSICRLVAEPCTGRLAAWIERRGEPDELVVLGPDFTVIARTGIPDMARGSRICFCGPGILLAYGAGPMAAWHVGSSAISRFAASSPPWADDVQCLPGERMLVVRHTAFGRATEYLDARTLQPIACPDALAWTSDPGGTRHLSSDGRYAAFWHLRRDELEIRDLRQQEISELVSRPLARFRPADLPAVTELAGGLRDQGATGLLRSCLEYRFGSDVAIDDAPSSAPGMDDIRVTRE